MRDPMTLSSDELIGLIVDARWFAAKGRTLESAEVVGVPVDEALFALAIVEVRFAAGTHEHYLVALGEEDGPAEVFERPEVATRLAALAGVAAEGARVRSLGVEQSNSSVVLDELHVLKLYRRLEAGPNPELELLRALAARRFSNAPRLEGALETEGPPLQTALASVTALVPSLGGGWELTLESLGDDDRPAGHQLGGLRGGAAAALRLRPARWRAGRDQQAGDEGGCDQARARWRRWNHDVRSSVRVAAGSANHRRAAVLRTRVHVTSGPCAARGGRPKGP